MRDQVHGHTKNNNLPKKANTKNSCSGAEIGGTCLVCDQGILEYNNLLNLVCPHCGREWRGSFT